MFHLPAHLQRFQTYLHRRNATVSDFWPPGLRRRTRWTVWAPSQLPGCEHVECNLRYVECFLRHIDILPDSFLVRSFYTIGRCCRGGKMCLQYSGNNTDRSDQQLSLSLSLHDGTTPGLLHALLKLQRHLCSFLTAILIPTHPPGHGQQCRGFAPLWPPLRAAA
jgi:hypothetical protein